MILFPSLGLEHSPMYNFFSKLKKQLTDCFLCRDDSVEFEHFEVIRTSGGYKVNVQNPVRALPLLIVIVDIAFWSVGSSSH